ncbi:DUF2474 family protein [Vibrio profundi]
MKRKIHKLGWFISIWIVSVMSLTIVAYLIRLALDPALQ